MRTTIGTLVWVHWYRYIGAYNPYKTPIESLNESRPERIKFYLSKADTVSSQSDRQCVLMQITQELCKRNSLNRAGFDMPMIFIPTLTGKVKYEMHLEDIRPSSALRNSELDGIKFTTVILWLIIDNIYL